MYREKIRVKFEWLLRVGLLVLVTLSIPTPNAYAANSKSLREITVRSKDIRSISVKVVPTASKKAKTKKYVVKCHGNTPGQTRTIKKKLLFISFKNKLKSLRRRADIYLYKQLDKAGTKACRALNKPTPTPTIPAPTATPIPDAISLEKYTGPFGETEARTLLERFAFGADHEEVLKTVAMGMDQAVTKLLTYVPEPQLDAEERDLRCNGQIGNNTCNPQNPNDSNRRGVQFGLYHRAIFSKNPLFERLFLFYHDERLAVNMNADEGTAPSSIPLYVDMVQRAARSGDYVQYMREWNADLLGNLIWLDGGKNHLGFLGDHPNQNYAREFWELGTIGAIDLYGNPNYTDLDIAQGALAMSGWTVAGTNVNGWLVYKPQKEYPYHAQGPKHVFIGTPYEAVVDTDEDLLLATFKNPHTSESLAKDLWKEFVNPNVPVSGALALAQVIREKNYNINAALDVLMRSKALYAAENRKTLIKHPYEMLIGFLRQTGLPTYYEQVDAMLKDMGERPLLPETVFGWDEKFLASDNYVLAWRNAVTVLLRRNWETFYKYGWDPKQRYFSKIPTNVLPSTAVINMVAADLGVTLTSAQKEELEHFMNYNLSNFQCPQQCDGQPFKMWLNTFDPSRTDHWERQIAGLPIILATIPEYRTK